MKRRARSWRVWRVWRVCRFSAVFIASVAVAAGSGAGSAAENVGAARAPGAGPAVSAAPAANPARTQGAIMPGAAASCASCHGANGAGNPAMGAPRLAGLPGPYLARQLAAYAEGTRAHPLMTPVAKGIPAGERTAVGEYFAQLAAPWQRPASAGSGAALERARQLLLQGDGPLRVQACVNCHGPGGSGEPPGIPGLNGQPQAYLAAALTAWKDNARRTDPSRQMNAVAQRLSADDIGALAQYLAAQEPAPPARGNEPVNPPVQPTAGRRR